MAPNIPVLSDVEFLMLARAIAQKKYSKGLFSASNVYVTAKWKKKVSVQIRECLLQRSMGHDLALKLHSDCPRALLKKLKLIDIVESVIHRGDTSEQRPVLGHQITVADEIFHPSTPPPPRPPSAPPSVNGSPGPAPRPSTPRSPPHPTAPPLAPDLSGRLVCRRLKPREIFAHWSVGSQTSRNSITKLLQLFQTHCPVVDFRDLPATATTLLKVRDTCIGEKLFFKWFASNFLQERYTE